MDVYTVQLFIYADKDRAILLADEEWSYKAGGLIIQVYDHGKS